jgi:hypothetical protein
MTYDKKITKVPDFFKIYKRQRMGKDSQTQELTKETFTNVSFPSEKGAIEWIREQHDHGTIFVIRNRKDEMINSYGWKSSGSIWGVINRTGYFGNYKIGNPNDPNRPSCFQCNCGGPCKDPNHPSTKKPL